MPRETGLPRRRSRSPSSCSRAIHRRYASRYCVVGIPTSLSRLRLAVSVANRSPPSRSAPPRQPSRPSHAVSFTFSYPVPSPRILIHAIIILIPRAFSRNCRANGHIERIVRSEAGGEGWGRTRALSRARWIFDPRATRRALCASVKNPSGGAREMRVARHRPSTTALVSSSFELEFEIGILQPPL